MFSNSASYLGGANSGRPGMPPYGQQSFGQQPQQQPPNQFSPPATGFAGGMQPQLTGYPGFQQQQQPQPVQPQYTGYPVQNGQHYQPPLQHQQFNASQQPQPQQQSYQTGLQPFPPAQQQQQQFQSAPQGSPPAPRQQPQPTGLTSSQMADSFRSSPAQTTQPSAPPPSSSKIPNMRLSFITAEDQAKFEQLFKSAIGSEQAISGDKARDLLLRSKLPGDVLSEIWYYQF